MMSDSNLKLWSVTVAARFKDGVLLEQIDRRFYSDCLFMVEHAEYERLEKEIERLRGFLTEIEGPGTMDEKTFFARQALDTKRVTVHGPQCACGRCEAQRNVHTL